MKNETLLHIPHAATAIPEKYLSSFPAGKLPRELAVMTDWFCDELFPEGRERIVFPVSRLLCDVERFREDGKEVMAQIGMGTVYESCSDLRPLRRVTAMEKEQILREYYDAHHRIFTAAVDKRLNKFGRCLIIDCHSFFPTPLPYERDQSPDRPDFCIGTDEFHTPPAMADALAALLEGEGFTVRINSPFSGAIVPMKHYGKTKAVSSVMLEVNRRLYLSAPGVKGSNFDHIRGILQRCVQTAETFR